MKKTIIFLSQAVDMLSSSIELHEWDRTKSATYKELLRQQSLLFAEDEKRRRKAGITHHAAAVKLQNGAQTTARTLRNSTAKNNHSASVDDGPDM